MAKLIDLTGATITVPAGWTASAGYGMFYLTGGGLYEDPNGDNDYFPFDPFVGSNFNIGFGANDDLSADRIFLYYNSSGEPGSGLKHIMTNNNSFKINNIQGNSASDQSLIQWFLDNNATIEGGVWEEEHTVQIINPQMYILPPTKVVGNDLVVSAEEVVGGDE